jgi:hypothetical protein
MRDTVTEGLNSRVIADFSAPIASASSVVGMDKDAELVELLLGLKQTDRPAYDAVILLLRRMVERKSQNQPLQS